MCPGLWHGGVRGLPAHFIHPCWQPRLLFTLCGVHMASRHITKAEITFWNMTLQQRPQNTKTHLVSANTNISAPRSALLSSHGVCDGSVFIHRSNVTILLATSDQFFFKNPYPLSYICFCCNYSWKRHRGGHSCKTKTSLTKLHNLIWPGTQTPHCYIIWCLHSPGSPVFSLSAFYRMQFCCSAPNKWTEDVINTRYFAFDPERISFMSK